MISIRLEPWGEMAGIIAQLTRAARIRRDRRTYGTNKCLYTLQPFDTNGFQVKIFHSLHSLIRSSIGQSNLHNKYCVQKARWEDHLRNIKEEEEIIISAYRQYKVVFHIDIFHITLALTSTGCYQSNLIYLLNILNTERILYWHISLYILHLHIVIVLDISWISLNNI